MHSNRLQACLDTVHAFFDALDTHDNAKAQAVFLPDGVWERGGASLAGHARIAEALAQRSADRRTFHVVCNPIVKEQGADAASVHFYLMAYEGVAGQPAPLQPIGIRRCVDQLRFDGKAWRIAHKSSQAHLPLPAAAP
jgi:hypothetical protein